MRKLSSKLSFLIVGVALILFPAVSYAADTSGKGPMDFDFKTAGWTVGIFLTALLILKKAAWGPIVKAMEEREHKIKESLEAADRMQAQMEQTKAENEEILREARREASEIVAEGKRDAQAVAEQVKATAAKDAQAMRDKALAEISRAKDVAIDEVHKLSVDLSLTISERLIGRSLDGSDHQRIAQEAIEQYQKID